MMKTEINDKFIEKERVVKRKVDKQEVKQKEIVVIAKKVYFPSEKAIEQFMEEAVAAKCEGLILKYAGNDSFYDTTGKRSS